jgi:prepilin-type N-terminal cleavage/methylation domain-containing protein
MNARTNKGFTLVELMVVIVIVGILAAVAVPKFTVASHKAKASEFPTVLTSVYTAEHTYQAEVGTFAATFTDMGVSIPDNQWFTYGLDAGTESFDATAGVNKNFGDAVAGTDNGTIDEQGNKGGTSPLLQYAPTWTNN